MSKDYKKMFDILNEYITNMVKDTDKTILQTVESRKNGKSFTFTEHLKGLIFSLLSNQRDWSAIHKNRTYIEKVFFYFDKNLIKKQDSQYFIKELTSHSLGNRAINEQMKSLNYNIAVLERIEKEYNSLDNFITRYNPQKVAELISSQKSQYKLKQIGLPLALEYLRNVGIDMVKPDVHIVRIFKRLGLIEENCSEGKSVLKVIEKLSLESGYSKVYIDFLLWHYCAEGYGNICCENSNCHKCVIKEFCVNPSISINSIQKNVCHTHRNSTYCSFLKPAYYNTSFIHKEVNNIRENSKETITLVDNNKIVQEIEEYLSTKKINDIITTKEFKEYLSKTYHRSDGSYIPSDYCYNRTNEGIDYSKQPHYFLYLKRGIYKYVGKNYNFTGIVEQNPRNKKLI